LKAGPFVWTPAGDDLGLRVARVVKFGVPGTDMPGHEVLTDSEIQALTKTVLELRGTR
jgi:cytochrome c oxidase cbb3-type subunit 2